MHRLSYKTLFIILFFLLIPIVFLIKTNSKVKDVAAGWWDEAWSYRQRIDVAGTATNLTDFQVSLNIGTSALIASGKMKSDCSDIRFTDNTGNILPYWIEENNPGCNQITDTKIWIKAPSVPTTGTAVYLYYGNSQAQSTQNGNEVFEFFDDFDDNNISDWTQQSGSTWTVSGGIVATTSDGKVMYHNLPSTLSSGIIIMGRSRITQAQYWNDIGIGIGNSSFNGYNNTIGYGHATRGHVTVNGARGTSFTATTDWTIGTSFHVNEYSYDGSGHHVAKCYNNGNSVSWTDGTYTNMDKITLYHQTYTTGALGSEFDWITARKFSSSDPTPTLQSEETSPAPIAYWKFDEGVGSTAHDSTSRSNHGNFGTTTASPTWTDQTQCISQKCLRFDGGDALIVGNKPDLNFERTASFSISAWFKTSISGNLSLVSKMGGAPYTGYEVFLNNGRINFYLINNYGGGDYIQTGTNNTYNDNQWHQVVVTYNGNSNANGVVIYIDSEVATQTVTSNNLTSTIINSNNVRLGSRDAGAYNYNGYLDEVKIFPYVRSATQVGQDYSTNLVGLSNSSDSSVNIGSNSQKSLSDGLVGYWKLDEGVGTTSLDSSGNSNTATFLNAGWTSGKFGIGSSFDGSTDVVNVANSTSLQTPVNNQWSMSAWVYPTDNTSLKVVFRKHNGGAGYFIRILNGNFESLFNFVEGYTQRVGGTVDTNVWQLLTVTYDGTTRKHYKNGIEVASWAENRTLTFDTSPITFGSAATTGTVENFIGTMDEVRIYNRSLSATEVSDLYNFSPGPVGHWKFDEGVGTTAFDSSGNNNNGAWQGTLGNQWVTGKIGKAGKFNATNNQVSIADTSILEPPQITLSMWFKTSETAEKNLISKGENNYYLRIYNGRIGFWLNSVCTGWLETTNTYNDNKWHHVSATYSNTSKLIYIDGTLQASNTACAGGSIPQGVSPIQIGARGSSFYWNGQLDDVKIYNYARTQKQILQDMGGQSGPLVHYKFDEGFGSIVNNSGSLSIGLSAVFGSGNSSPSWAQGKIGKALSFNGVSSHVALFGSTTVDNIGTSGDFSVSAWNYQSSFSSIKAITSQLYGSHTYGRWLLGTNSNKGFISVYGGNSSPTYKLVIGNINLSPNTWNNITGVYSRQENLIKLYVNGVYDKSTYWDGNIEVIQSDRIRIGGNIVNQYMNGLIDEVKIYNYALTDSDVKTDYNQGSAFVFGASNQTIGGTTTSLEYCPPGDGSTCSPPVAQWNFEEAVGTTAYDSSGNNVNLRIYNAQSTTGKIGKSLSFTGTTSYATYPDPGTTPLDITGNVTLQAWVKWREFKNYGSIAQKGTGGSGNSFNYALWSYSNQVSAFIANGTSNQSVNWASSNISLNQWHHVSLVADGSYLRLYVDGIQRASTAQSITPSSTDSPFSVSENTNSINADIDQVRVYNYARTPAQVAYDYSKGAPIAHFKFDECQSNISHSSTGVGITGTINIGSGGTQSSIGTCTTTGAWASGATGKINSSLNLDGVDDNVRLGAFTSNQSYSHSFSAWVKTTAAPSDNKFLFDSSVGRLIFAWNSATTGKLGYNDGTWRNSTVDAPNDGNWHMITYVLNSINNVGQIYVDGQLRQDNIGYSPKYISGQSAIGSRYDGTLPYYFAGQIDDVRIYNYPLTAEQVKQVYNGGSINFN